MKKPTLTLTKKVKPTLILTKKAPKSYPRPRKWAA